MVTDLRSGLVSADRSNQDVLPVGRVIFGVLAEIVLVLLWALSVTAHWHDDRGLSTATRAIRVALVSLPVMLAVWLWQRRVDRRLARTRRDMAAGTPAGRAEHRRDERRTELGFVVYLTVCLALLAWGSIPHDHSSTGDTVALAVFSFCVAYVGYFCATRIRRIRGTTSA